MRTTLIVFLSFFALPVAAFEACTATSSEIAEAIKGNWQVRNTAGFARMQGNLVPLPPGNSSTAQIKEGGFGMEITSVDLGGQTLPLSISSNRIYTLDLVGDKFVEAESAVFEGLSLKDDLLDPSDAALVLGCGPNNLPMLEAQGTIIDPESGMSVAVNLTLFVMFGDLMYGVTSGKTPIGVAKRMIRFSR